MTILISPDCPDNDSIMKPLILHVKHKYNSYSMDQTSDLKTKVALLLVHSGGIIESQRSGVVFGLVLISMYFPS